ncbi:nucleotide disphospho-sugar-binding domain-containing protein [Streptomyces sp. RPT161]|uniref:nucleotide disphospho-sugar-binding domain-containing protein n=1 Tax=Streptomyces sp. RPT161 TaxID=3015993 RepID=UPI0022B8D9E6|nr:nucleotide disphospho-sugar-binding domain-containing protein [Streptomyces sp. RPT161]
MANHPLHRWLSQLAVLQQADVFVTHAGMSSTVQGIWSGVPMLAVPQALDQFTNADSITRLGIGRKLCDTRSAPALREAVLDLASNSRITANVEKLRKEVRAADGTRRAVEIIEQQLGAVP